MVKRFFTDTIGIMSSFGKNSEVFSKHQLNYLANKLSLQGSKEVLMTSDDLKDKITLFPHQAHNALKYLNDIPNGSLLIADEVGLGKTISAGIILKELIYRYEIKKILILCPSPLQEQWKAELETKFAEVFEINQSVHNWETINKIICSIDTAKQEKHIQRIKSIHWDLIIVDEAHRLKNNKTQAYKALEELKCDYKLFLTATPIQNSMIELYNIINLLEFGYFGTSQDFSRTYLSDKSGRKIKNVEELQYLLSKVMVRNTRKSTGLEFVARHVHTIKVKSSQKEIEFQDAVLNFLSIEYEKIQEDKRKLGIGKIQLINLLRQLSGDRFGFSLSFKKYIETNLLDTDLRAQGDEILAINEELPVISKMDSILNIIKKIKDKEPNDKVIIFTTYLQVQNSIVRTLETNGYKVEMFNGSMSNEEKNQAIKNFKDISEILVSTESGSEGRNLQFASHLINYDLPWNPMRVEQRIGRIHRIGQTKDVNIYNIILSDSIEEAILERLYEKIDLFNVAIGEMDTILNEVVDSSSFESEIAEILLRNKKINAKAKLEEYFNKIKESKNDLNEINKLNAKTLDHFDLSPYKND